MKLDRTSTIKKFVAARKIKDSGEKTIPFKSVEGEHRCIKIQERKHREALEEINVVQAGNVVVLDKK